MFTFLSGSVSAIRAVQSQKNFRGFLARVGRRDSNTLSSLLQMLPMRFQDTCISRHMNFEVGVVETVQSETLADSLVQRVKGFCLSALLEGHLLLRVAQI